MLGTSNERLRETQMVRRPQRLAYQPDSLLCYSAEPRSSEPLCRSPAPMSPRTFAIGAVGLGIVAAMSDSVGRAPKPASPTRSDPIPIASPRPTAGELKRPISIWEEEEAAELSESYTCVISHVGGGSVRKRVYLDDGTGGKFYGDELEVFCESPPRVAPAEFLSRCHLCRNNLHGTDIFMYRGDKAFRSMECRCQQIRTEELREKLGPEALKKPFDCSVSPCSATLVFPSGVVVA